MNKALYIILSVCILWSCNKTEDLNCDDSKELHLSATFPIGVAINMDNFMYDSTYRHIAHRQFNSITAENIFKANYLHPQKDVYNWTYTDLLADFCIKSSKRLHGHTLIWHEQVPQWIKDYKGSKEEWEQLFKSHIQTIVSHFKGKVTSWDVVNEAFNEDGTLRNTVWTQHIGDSYIEKAFTYTREADPEVLLFYNDYNLESNFIKRNNVIQYLNHLRNRGVRIDGVGLQMHINIYTHEAAQFAKSFQHIVDNNYRLHLSELDISVNPNAYDIEPSRALFEKQADLLGKIILHYKQIAAEYQYGITFWGISDKDSWIRHYYNREDYPLLYDDKYIPKPVYCKLKQIL